MTWFVISYLKTGVLFHTLPWLHGCIHLGNLSKSTILLPLYMSLIHSYFISIFIRYFYFSYPIWLTKPLLLTRHPIIIPIHLDAWTITQKELRFIAWCHLRAMGPTVTTVLATRWTRTNSFISANHDQWRWILLLLSFSLRCSPFPWWHNHWVLPHPFLLLLGNPF